MNIDFSAREFQLQELRQFISDAQKKILYITSELNWDPKSLEKGKEMVVCPFDEGHVISEASLKNHLEKCKLRKEGYHPEDVPFPPVSVDPSSSSVLKVDRNLQAYIVKQAKEKKPDMLIGFPGQVDDREVPMSSDRFMSSLTSDEKSAIHSYVIANTVSPGEGKDIDLNEQDLEINYKNKKEEKKDKTPLEKLIEERDAKRRKEGKKVHINRKSHTEIIREVIENQMEIYVEWLRDENMLEKEKSETVKVEILDTQPVEEESKNTTINEGDSCTPHEDSATSFAYDRRKRYKEYEQHKDRRKDVDHSDIRWKNERFSNLREEDRDYGASRHKDYESFRYKDSETSRHRSYHSRHYREWDYDRKSHKNHRDDSKDDHDKARSSKYEGTRTWDDDSFAVKEEYDEEHVDRSIKRDRVYSTDNEKQDRDRKSHKSKRHCHDSNSESERSSKHKKKKKHHKRSD